MTFLSELKARPEEERAAFAATMAIIVVVVLVLVWVTSFFLKGRSVADSGEIKAQTASAAASFNQLVDQTSDAINSVTGQYKELQGKTEAVGAQRFATTKIEEATENFMKIRYDADGNMYIEDNTPKSLLNEAADEIPDVLNFPY